MTREGAKHELIPKHKIVVKLNIKVFKEPKPQTESSLALKNPMILYLYNCVFVWGPSGLSISIGCKNGQNWTYDSGGKSRLSFLLMCAVDNMSCL